MAGVTRESRPVRSWTGPPPRVISMRKALLPVLLAALASTAAAQTTSQPAPVASLRPQWARAVWTPGRHDGHQRERDEPLGGFLGPSDQDHRYEGFFVGAGLGVTAALVALAWCDEDSSCDTSRGLVMAPVVVGILGLSGAVLGGLIPKSPSAIPMDP